MGDLVDGLLRLSRVSSGMDVPQAEAIAVQRLVADAWRSVGAGVDPGEDGPSFESSGASELVVRTDRSLLGIAVGNLLSNAVKHGARAAPIRCRAEIVGDCVRLTISNRAPNLRAADLAHLCEPFWTADPARSGGRSAGLGLALTRAIASALGASLSFELRDGELHAQLDLPATAAATHATATRHPAITSENTLAGTLDTTARIDRRVDSLAVPPTGGPP